MNFSTTLKAAIAAAIVMGSLQVQAATVGGAYGPANSGIVVNQPSGGNSDLLFFAFDSSGKSYVMGLNTQMDAFIANAANQTNYSLSGLSAFFAASPDAKWGVAAADSLQSGTFAGYRIMATSGTATGPTELTNLGVKNAALQLHTLETLSLNPGPDGVLGTADDPTPGVALKSTDPLAPTNLFNATTWGETWATRISSGAVGAATDGALLGFYLLDTQTSTSGTAKPATNTLANKGLFQLLGNFKLSLASDQVIFNEQLAPIPVPAAVWMMGSALATLAASRRRKA